MTATTAQRIQDAADRNIALLSRLDLILEEESLALRRHEVDAIHQALDGKLAVLHELEITGRHFIELTTRHRIDPKNDNVDNWLGSPSLAASSRQLRHMLAACDDKNRANGSVIDVNRKFVENLLSILQTGQPQARTYDRSGRLDAVNGGQARARI